MVARRLFRPSSLWAVAFLLGLPALAQAQLFPNLPIRRQRPDCAAENPQNKMIRQEYWGYYPTCWRKFPPGWGCPSPEAPNWEASKRDTPFELNPKPAPDSGADDTPDPNANRPNGAANPGPAARPPDTSLPELPTGDSPFNMNPKPDGDRPKDPADAPNLAPPTDPPGTRPTASAAPRRNRSVLAGYLNGRKR